MSNKRPGPWELPKNLNPLPVDSLRRPFIEALRSKGRVLLAAPTGSGKSSRLPLYLLADLALPGEIVVLQPRRLACRLLAHRVASELGETPGRTVGYETRTERLVGPSTRIRFVTDGLFLRQHLSNPSLEGVSAVLFDEFHERTIPGDLLVSLCRTLQTQQRKDLLLVVMSATLDAQELASFLDAPVLHADARAYPVSVRHLAAPTDKPVWQLAADAVVLRARQGLQDPILVFMPGMDEIRRTLRALDRRLPADIPLLPLHASLPPAQQDLAVSDTTGPRVIVTTNVAETSLTIPGVRTVIDSGLVRQLEYDPGRGLDMLNLRKASLSSASQRAGRAGRTGPGECVRLWIEAEERLRPTHDLPQILRSELSQPTLLLLALGITDLGSFPWLSPPRDSHLEDATRLLHRLGATDRHGRLTDLGRDMAKLSLHPRVSRMVLEATHRGVRREACFAAALLEEGSASRMQRTPPAPGAAAESDISVWLEEMELPETRESRPLRTRIRETSRRIERQLSPRQGGSASSTDPDRDLALSLVAGWPDRLGFRSSPTAQSYEIPSTASRVEGVGSPTPGRTSELAVLSRFSQARGAPLLLALDIEERRETSGRVRTIHTAVPLEASDLASLFPEWLSEETVQTWNDQRKAVEWWLETRINGSPIQRKEAAAPSAASGAAVLAAKVQIGELRLKHWDERVAAWMDRVRFVASQFPERNLLTYDPDDVRVILEEICDGASSYSAIKDRPCLDGVRSALSFEDQRFVESMAPERIRLPNGFGMKVRYELGKSPVGRARIQDLYDLPDTPVIAGGRIRLVLEILAPSQRPIQVTDDLKSFWSKHYPELKKALQRRYPKHQWR